MNRFVVGILAAGVSAGCTTTKQPTAVSHLQIRVAHVENQLDDQDREITALKLTVEDLSGRVRNTAVPRQPAQSTRLQKEEPTTPPDTSPSKYKRILRVPVAPQEVQTALQNAGYYSGAIDGKLGSGSQKAIQDFQKDHDLKRDGIIGKKTWAELKHYLE